MYFSKESVLTLYGSLSSLYPKDDIEQQGGTQFASEIKYFLATDYFKRQKGKPCDTRIKDDKEFFVHSVGKVVLLSDNGNYLATKNFAKSVGDARDFDVGSNFFSANAVAKSKITPDPQKFPNRHPQLLTIISGVIDTYSGGYENLANDKEYLGGNIRKYAILFLWLNRFSDFGSKDSIYDDCLLNLRRNFSSELISSLRWSSKEVQNEVANLLVDIQLVDNQPNFERKDFSADSEIADSSSSKSLQCVKIPLDITSENDKNQIKQNLIMKLNEIESTEKGEGFNLLSQLVLFGIQNGKLISENGILPNELASESNISDNYHQHLRFGTQIYNYAKKNKWIENLGKSELHKTPLNTTISPIPTATPHTSPEQIIFYGVPGSGKSHEIKQKLVTEYNMPEEKHDVFVERTVFHPEYTNADFIGQIMPKLVQGKTDFIFKPGPFTSILKKALHDSQSRYVLIIEEINRGNAAAIFGELFQLLDRIDDESKLTYHENELNFYGKGWSEYFVMNSGINNYIRDSDDSFDGKALDLNGIHFSANTGIRLPPNLSILATMNTSDQNVFTLDNAFQRRWNMKLIENVFGDTDKENSQKGAFIDTAKTITWEKFQKTINIKIGEMSEEAGLSSMEDKRIGCWFVKATKLGNDYIIPKDLFVEKVLKYLWDDAFKFCREKVFNSYTNLESLTRDFKNDKEFSVFKDLFSEIEN